MSSFMQNHYAPPAGIGAIQQYQHRGFAVVRHILSLMQGISEIYSAQSLLPLKGSPLTLWAESTYRRMRMPGQITASGVWPGAAYGCPARQSPRFCKKASGIGLALRLSALELLYKTDGRMLVKAAYAGLIRQTKNHRAVHARMLDMRCTAAE